MWQNIGIVKTLAVPDTCYERIINLLQFVELFYVYIAQIKERKCGEVRRTNQTEWVCI